MRMAFLILMPNPLISLNHEEGTRMRKAALMMRKSVMSVLRIDPDGGVLDLPRASGMRALVVGRQDWDALVENLAGLGVDDGIAAEAHVPDDEIPEMRLRAGEAVLRKIPAELDLPLDGEDREPFANTVPSAEIVLVLEGFGELGGGVEPSHGRLVEDQPEDDQVLAIPLRVMPGAQILAHQPLAARGELGPGAIHLVDHLGRQRGPVAQLDLQPALAGLLLGPVQDQAGGVEAAERAGAGERQERVLLYLVLRQLLGVVDEDHAAVGIDVVAQHLDPVLEEEHHGGVVVLAAAIGPAIE